MKQPVLFTIPAGTPMRACRSCNDPIAWIVTASGKKMPCNPDGTSHFSTCPDAAAHRKPRPT